MDIVKPELDVGLVPSDPDATCAFYRDVMGFAEQPSLPLGKRAMQHRFRVGGHVLKCNRLAEPPAREPGGVERAIGMRLLAFIVDDLDALLGRLDAAGKKHSTLPVPESSTFRVAFTKDPDGNVLELVGLKQPAGDKLRARLQIGLTVSDIERSRHFYGKQLGLPEEPIMKVGGTVDVRYGFTWGTTTIKFWHVPGELPRQTGAPNDHSGIRMFTAMVKDMDAARAELVARDIPIVMETELPGVARILFFADPDGNWIELAQRIQ
jgi:catechol 2,3-dioxygenase-like lactoylglutathione lyase family enzyme